VISLKELDINEMQQLGQTGIGSPPKNVDRVKKPRRIYGRCPPPDFTKRTYRSFSASSVPAGS